MPRVPDKIILNGPGIESFGCIIAGYMAAIALVMAAGEKMGWEIEENQWGMEADALDFLSDQQSDCAVIDAAGHLYITQLADFHKKQLMRNDAMRVWIDKMLAAKP